MRVTEMSNRIKTLRLLAEFLLTIYYRGEPASIAPDEAKKLADMCCIVLPMRYRFTKTEVEMMKTGRPNINLIK